MSAAIEPGAAIGVFGGGQLGRMFAQAAQRLGYAVHVYAPEPDSPAAAVADAFTCAAWDDLAAIERFARSVAVATFEFENVPAAALERAERYTTLRPGPRALRVSQNRLREKAFLVRAGLAVAPYAEVHSGHDAAVAAARIGTPAILKSAELGYDGKGQVRVDHVDGAADAFAALGTDEAVLESFVSFERELSVLVARGANGEMASFGPIANVHRDHILDLSVCPAAVAPRIASDALAIGRTVAEALELVGVVCVELFQLADGTLLVNEIAPRPHNSGHLTIDACATSQFEQQARAVCGLPLGAFDALSPAAMVNLLGDLWSDGSPQWSAACGDPWVKLHLYGKREARPGRKMGHLTALAPDPTTAANRALEARRRARPRRGHLRVVGDAAPSAPRPGELPVS